MKIGDKIKGKTIEIQRTGEVVKRGDENWEKCIFTLELTRLTTSSTERFPPVLKGKIIRIVRYCLYDWHYKLGVEKTLEPEETKAVIDGKPTENIYW